MSFLFATQALALVWSYELKLTPLMNQILNIRMLLLDVSACLSLLRQKNSLSSVDQIDDAALKRIHHFPKSEATLLWVCWKRNKVDSNGCSSTTNRLKIQHGRIHTALSLLQIKRDLIKRCFCYPEMENGSVLSRILHLNTEFDLNKWYHFLYKHFIDGL